MTESLQFRMLQYEVAPPPDAWKAIAARLDDDAKYSALNEKIHGFEMTPPPAAWDNIVNELNEYAENNEAPIVPITKKRSYYGIVAAVSVAIIFLVGWIWFNQPGNHVATSVSSKSFVKRDLLPNASAAVTGIFHPKEENKQTVKAIAGNEKNNSNKVPDKSIKYAAINIAPFTTSPIAVQPSPDDSGNGSVTRDMQRSVISNNYIVIASPDGQSTRVSAKFANVLRYLYDDNTSQKDYLDRVIINAWKKRFDEWRNKIGRSSFIPTSVNFLDIADLKELIDEK